MVKQFIYIFLLLAIITVALYLVYIHYNLAEIEEGFQYIGTYKDYGDRILGTSDMNKVPRVTNADECNEIAQSKGHPYFGLEWNECHTGLLTQNSDGTYGPLKNTGSDGKLLSPDGKTTRNWVNEPTNTKLNNPETAFGWGVPQYEQMNSTSAKGTVNAGGGWLMSLYKADNNTILNSTTNKNSPITNSIIDTSYEYFESGTLREGFDVKDFKNQPLPKGINDSMTIEEINQRLGFHVDVVNYDSFIKFLYYKIHLPVKTLQQNTPPANTTNTNITNKYGVLKNMDSAGNDITYMDGTLDDCKNACNENTNCAGIGFDRRNNKTGCYIKNRNMFPNGGPLAPLPNFDTYWNESRILSNYKFLPNTDSMRNDIIQFQPTTVQDCAKECNSRTNCAGFGFSRRNMDKNKCYLKTTNMYPNGQKQDLPNFDIYWNPNKIPDKNKKPTPKIIMFDGYPQFIHHLVTKGIKSYAQLKRSHNVNDGFTTIEGATTFDLQIPGIDNNIVQSSSDFRINLSNSSFPKLIQNNTGMSEVKISFQELHGFGITDLQHWYDFKDKLSKIGVLTGYSDSSIIQTLKDFGYTTFQMIEEIGIDKFTDPYDKFGFKPESPIIGFDGYFGYLKSINVDKSNFNDFVGESGLQQFNTSNYTVNASTFFVNSDINSNNPGLYWLMKSIDFMYDSSTFDTFVTQVKKMGIITPITTAATQEDLKNYVLHLTVNPTDDIIRKFKIFIKTINSIEINTFKNYTDFVTYYSVYLKVEITNLQIFIVQFRYYYIFLSKGMDSAYKHVTPVTDATGVTGTTDAPADEKTLVSDFMNDKITTPYHKILWFLTEICNLKNFDINRRDDFSKLMHKAIQYGWDYETIATDSPIGNSYTDMVRQGVTSITEMFSSIAESFMGRDPFTNMNVGDEQTALYSFSVIPMYQYNPQMLGLFGKYSITQWDDIMQYVVRFNKLMIPFNGDPNIPNPKNNPSNKDYNASTTLALFAKFGVKNGTEGLDLFDHLLHVVKVPSAKEMFRFINTLILFKVTYSTYDEFYRWFESDHLHLVYGNNGNPNYEIFYMFLGDLMALSNAAVPFDYAEGRNNFETLVQNMQLDVFVTYTDETGVHTYQIHTGNEYKLNHYPSVYRRIFFINYSYDKLISSTYGCSTAICNNLMDWTTPHIRPDRPGIVNKTYKNTLLPYINLDYKPSVDVGPDGNATPDPMFTWYLPGIKNVFSYLTQDVELSPKVPLNDSSQPTAQLTDKNDRFNLAFCIGALTGNEATTLKTCQYNITNDYKIQLINKMIPNMIQKNIDTNNNPNGQRSSSTVPIYNKNVETINFLILYPLLAFEIIAGAMSNPCKSVSGCPELPENNYDTLFDGTLDYTYTNNTRAMNANYNVGGQPNTMRPDVFGPNTFKLSTTST
jgi:hypothetical protein